MQEFKDYWINSTLRYIEFTFRENSYRHIFCMKMHNM